MTNELASFRMSDTLSNHEGIGLKDVRLEKVSTNSKPLRDYSEKFWELPFLAKDVAFVIKRNDNDQDSVNLGLASDTEGRSFHLQRFVFKFKGGKLSEIEKILPFAIPDELKRGKELRPVVFNDLQEKGGGTPEDHKTESVKHQEAQQGRTINYFPRKELGRTDEGPPAGASLNYDLSLDETFGVLFHLWGGRTRLPIATYPLENLNLPEGTLTVEEARAAGYLKDKDTPVTSDWGMRCRWRIDDITTLFSSAQQKSTSKAAVYFSTWLNPGAENYTYVNEPTEVDSKKAETFANELVSRMKNDDDVRWRNLGEKYTKVDTKNSAEFYLDYLTLLSRSVGEQMGILYKKDVVLYMLNFQNFSGLGEIFDFDVAVFRGKQFIDGVELTRKEMKDHKMLSEEEEKTEKDPDSARLHAETTFSAIRQITQLFAILRHPGIINIAPDEYKKRYDHAIAEFGKGFVQTGFTDKLDITAIPRNTRYIKHLENIFEDEMMWSSFPNPITESFKGINKFFYGPIANSIQKGRYFSIDKETLKNFA